jgi:hypothetical protein
MFGTLVIVLPSKHSGGEVHLSHAGKTRVFNSSKTSQFEFSYAAWQVFLEIAKARSHSVTDAVGSLMLHMR